MRCWKPVGSSDGAVLTMAPSSEHGAQTWALVKAW
jgi:hypothetical protein